MGTANRIRRAAGMGTAALVLLVFERSASAQLVSPPNGATGVPIDVIPFIDGFLEDGSVRLEDASGAVVDAQIAFIGNSVARDGANGTRSFEIIPASPLKPDTTYTIGAVVNPSNPTTFASTFTTGTGPANEPPPPVPEVTVQLSSTRAESGYFPLHACLYAKSAAFVEVTNEWMRFIRPGADHALYGIGGDPEDCIEVRARNVAGVRSPPVRRCSIPYFPPEGWLPRCVEGRVFVDGRGFADEGFGDAGNDDAGAPDAITGDSAPTDAALFDAGTNLPSVDAAPEPAPAAAAADDSSSCSTAPGRRLSWPLVWAASLALAAWCARRRKCEPSRQP